jgi:c-di-GMP-binding flagellar brake protein YcgR
MKTVEQLLSIAHTPVGRSVVEPPPPPEYYSIQRRGGRVRLCTSFRVMLQSRDATLIDISLSGALVEHTTRSHPGEIYRLSLPTECGHLQVRARAVRALVSHRVSAEEGVCRLVYRTGLEFVGFGEELAKVLVVYIDRLRRQHAL